MRKIHITKFLSFKVVLLAVYLLGVSDVARSVLPDQQSVLRNWIPSFEVSMSSLRQFGINRCFSAVPISDSVFCRISGKSYKRYCTIPRSSLRYVKVLHYTGDGKILPGEIICNKRIANDLVEIFHTLFYVHYPIGRMRLVDDYGADDERSMSANNTTCFNFRYKTGKKTLSNHASGCAIDVNPFTSVH